VPDPIHNFGRNLSWTPSSVFEPRSEDELLRVLDECRGRRIRVVGSRHSWSEVVVAEDVMIDLRHLNEVRVEQREGKPWAFVGAGCTIERLLVELEGQAGVTLPSLGLITEQTIAGASATGTHGSGKNSLSHYLAEVRIATYDPVSGKPVIRIVNADPELRAARCALGVLGIIVSCGIWCRPQYHVEETLRRHRTLDEVLAAAERFPLQQFFLMPWLWQYVTQHRREVAAPRSWLATLYRCYFFLMFDVGLHLVILTLVWLRRRRLVHGFFRYLVRWTLIQRWPVVDKSSEMLVMEHELFRHVEIELFVVQPKLLDALAYVEEVVKYFDGDNHALSPATRSQLDERGLLAELADLCGSYTHHYPICVRKVLPDATMLSMSTGSEEPSYAISFISYDAVADLQPFLTFARFLSRSMIALFSARPHWGKICPLTAEEADRLYPELAQFRDICRQFDPAGVFRNAWLERVLSLDARHTEEPRAIG
jgi:FAD/FMN-containing dehydrogenase